MTHAPMNPYAPPHVPTDSPAALALAAPSDRLGAVALDMLLVLALAVVWGLASLWKAGALYVFSLAFLLLIGVQGFLLSTRGQTLGKRWTGLKIVKTDGSEAGFLNAFLLRSVLTFILRFIPLFGLVDVLFIFREDRRCVHDLIAGTTVVRVARPH